MAQSTEGFFDNPEIGITPRLAALRDGTLDEPDRSVVRRRERIAKMQAELADAIELALDLRQIAAHISDNPANVNVASVACARMLIIEAAGKANAHAERLRSDLAVLEHA